MKKGFSKNQKGSVLLAVVCMTMVCMTLATIALRVVNYTTGSSNRNVQRTQAKITAEACLTEFVEAYKTANGKYDDLLSLALGNSRETARTINVNMQGDADFDNEFGDCTLYIYKQGTGFRIDSVCQYASQEQTASVHFAAKKETPYVPSNCLEASQGASIADGVATPIGGSTYIEKDPSVYSKNSITTSNDATYEGHFFSEYNIVFNSGSRITDGINKTLTTNYYHPDNYFAQAPTMTVTGYFAFNNQGSITTDVGKTDINGKNSDDDDYDPNNLSNMDGYIYTFKKLIATWPGSGMQVGSAGKPIDVYCHGAYFGFLPDSIDGETTERAEILEAFDNSIPSEQVGDMTFNGNFYSYVGNASEMRTNGDVYIDIGSGHYITINGDMYIDGDIYLVNGSRLRVNGTLYCSGTIYKANQSGKVTTSVASGIITSSGGSNVIQIVTGSAGTDLGVYASALSSSVDKFTLERNRMPSEGYDPATGNDSDTRKGMSVYDGCAANDMFRISIDATQPLEQASTKYIGIKYVNALTRDLSSNYTTASGLLQPVSDTLAEDPNIVNIYGSVKLGASDVFNDDGSHVKKYLVRLTDQDIVIALPLVDKTVTSIPMWDGSVQTSVSINGNILSKFRIDRSGVASGENYFCYFMFYDPSDINKCYYIDSNAVVTSDEGVVMNLVGTTEAERSSKAISFAKGNSTGMSVADFNAIASATGSANIPDNFSAQNPPYNLLESPTHIMYLVPNDVTFRLGGTGQPSYIQGIVYAVESDVEIAGPNQNTIYGQVKCESFRPGGDIKSGVIQDCPIADGSLLGYVAEKNSTETSVKIQYYEY